jgi:hypothetical protein
MSKYDITLHQNFIDVGREFKEIVLTPPNQVGKFITMDPVQGTISFETPDHNALANYEADRHREMNYDENIKAYLIND